MKKVLVSMVCLMGLAGCAPHYDYFLGNVHYEQDGDDCIYYMTETAKNFDRDIRDMTTDKKIVYRNTMCRDLYTTDHAADAPRDDRRATVPAKTESEPVKEEKVEEKKVEEPVVVTPATPAPVSEPVSVQAPVVSVPVAQPVPAPVVVPTAPMPAMIPVMPRQNAGYNVPANNNTMMLKRRYMIVPAM